MKFLIYILFFIVFFSKLSIAEIYYCEVSNTAMIWNNVASKTALEGKKFKMEIKYPNVKFSEGVGLMDEYKIIDTWGGASSEFIAGDKTTLINFNDGTIYQVDINRLARMTSTFTAECQKF